MLLTIDKNPHKYDYSFRNDDGPKVTFFSLYVSDFHGNSPSASQYFHRLSKLSLYMSVFPKLSVCLYKPYGSLTKLVMPIILEKYLNVMSVFEGEKMV